MADLGAQSGGTGPFRKHGNHPCANTLTTASNYESGITIRPGTSYIFLYGTQHCAGIDTDYAAFLHNFAVNYTVRSYNGKPKPYTLSGVIIIHTATQWNIICISAKQHISGQAPGKRPVGVIPNCCSFSRVFVQARNVKVLVDTLSCVRVAGLHLCLRHERPDCAESLSDACTRILPCEHPTVRTVSYWMLITPCVREGT